MPHLGFEADREGFFGELLHGRAIIRECVAANGGPEAAGESGASAADFGRRQAVAGGAVSRRRDAAARSASEALENAKFYHGVVLPRQSLAAAAQNRGFSLQRP